MHSNLNSTPEPNAGIAGQVKRFEAVVDTFVEPDQPFALSDFPDHGNIGDSAIYAGELTYFDRRAGRPPSYVCSWKTYRQDIAHFCPEGPIFLHGGGNFGDIWPTFQKLRLDILQTYSDRTIVQMPQSIHFDEIAARDVTARAIAKARDFTLLVRDRPSFELAERHFDCKTLLCPDGAYNLRHLRATRLPTQPFVGLMRRDREAAAGPLLPIVQGAGPVLNWPARKLCRRPLTARFVEHAIAPRLTGSRMMMRHREWLFRAQARLRVRQGVDILAQGEAVITDRLHGHILASMMGKRHIALDNSYGKISRYLATWGDDGLAVPVGLGDPERLKTEIAAIYDLLRGRLSHQESGTKAG